MKHACTNTKHREKGKKQVFFLIVFGSSNETRPTGVVSMEPEMEKNGT